MRYKLSFVMRMSLLITLLSIVVSATLAYGAKAKSQATKDPQASQGTPPKVDQSNKTAALKTQRDQVNYAIGVNFIGTIKQQGIDIDLEMVIKGMRDAFADKDLQMSDGELRKALIVYQGEVRRMQAKTRAEVAENKQRESEAFLAENKQKEGIVTLPSGLQYRVLQEGQGKKPTAADTVEFHYRGSLINGTEFDSTFRTGRSVTYKVADLIPGWREALQLMPVGSKWQLFIPPRLAYGARGVKGSIGPNETLIFEMELLAIK